jgi:hypothetical protein
MLIESTVKTESVFFLFFLLSLIFKIVAPDLSIFEVTIFFFYWVLLTIFFLSYLAFEAFLVAALFGALDFLSLSSLSVDLDSFFDDLVFTSLFYLAFLTWIFFFPSYICFSFYSFVLLFFDLSFDAYLFGFSSFLISFLISFFSYYFLIEVASLFLSFNKTYLASFFTLFTSFFILFFSDSFVSLIFSETGFGLFFFYYFFPLSCFSSFVPFSFVLSILL